MQENITKAVKYSAWSPITRRNIAQKFKQWPTEDRLEYVKKIVMSSSEFEKHELAKIVAECVPDSAVDFTRLLPRPLSIYIFAFLDPRSLSRAAQVCWHWKSLTEGNAIWAPKCFKQGWSMPLSWSQNSLDPCAYKRLYVENVQLLQLDHDIQVEKAKKAARLRIAMENEGALKKTVETRHRPKRRMKPDERLVGSSDSTIMRNVDSKESRKTIERESPAIMSEKIRALSDRLAVPKRQPSTTVHTPILDIVRGVTGERGRFSGIKARGASRQPQQRLVAKMVVAPMGVRFATIAQSEAVQTLPSPPAYDADRYRSTGSTKISHNRRRQEQIYELLCGVPT